MRPIPRSASVMCGGEGVGSTRADEVGSMRAVERRLIGRNDRRDLQAVEFRLCSRGCLSRRIAKETWRGLVRSFCRLRKRRTFWVP